MHPRTIYTEGQGRIEKYPVLVFAAYKYKIFISLKVFSLIFLVLLSTILPPHAVYFYYFLVI